MRGFGRLTKLYLCGNIFFRRVGRGRGNRICPVTNYFNENRTLFSTYFRFESSSVVDKEIKWRRAITRATAEASHGATKLLISSSMRAPRAKKRVLRVCRTCNAFFSSWRVPGLTWPVLCYNVEMKIYYRFLGLFCFHHRSKTSRDRNNYIRKEKVDFSKN